MTGFVATAGVDVDAEPRVVWAALVDPAQIKRYMFGTDVESDWEPGSSIVWKGEYEGKSYEDKGEIVAVELGTRLAMTHYSPLSGRPDKPENYHRLDYLLRATESGTRLTLTQDGNASTEEADHAAENWRQMLDELKKVVEQV